jgi:ligand-binding sensor domain-containing protein
LNREIIPHFRSFYIDGSYGNELRINSINSIRQDSRGAVWVGTDGGLYSVLPAENELSTPVPASFPPHFLDLEITAVTEDRSGNLWVGTIGGLYMIDKKSKFKTYRIHDFMPESPRAASFIASIHLFDESELWLGTWGAGLFITDRNTGETRHYSSNAVDRSLHIPDDFVHVIYRNPQGRILIGTRNGLLIFRGRTAGFQPYCPSGNPEDCLVFSSNRIYSIMEDSQRVLWVGTRYGLHSFRNDTLVSLYHNPMDSNSLPSNHINDIVECRSGYLWLATADGLSRFSRESGSFTNFRRDPELGRFSLSHNELTCLLEDSSGNLWIGSVTGLNRFFASTESFIVFSELEGTAQQPDLLDTGG